MYVGTLRGLESTCPWERAQQAGVWRPHLGNLDYHRCMAWSPWRPQLVALNEATDISVGDWLFSYWSVPMLASLLACFLSCLLSTY